MKLNFVFKAFNHSKDWIQMKRKEEETLGKGKRNKK